MVAPFVERSGDTTFQATVNVIFEITADIFDTEFLYDEDPQMWGKGAKGEQKGGKGDWGKGSSDWGKGSSSWHYPSSPSSGPVDDGSTRFAYSLLYKERAKLKALEQATKDAETASSRKKETDEFRQEVCRDVSRAISGGPAKVEHSVYNSMIKSPSDEPKDGPSPLKGDSMTSSIWSMLKKISGGGSTSEKEPKKPKKKKSSSSRSSASSSTPSSKKKKRRKQQRSKERKGNKSDKKETKQKKEKKMSLKKKDKRKTKLPTKSTSSSGSAKSSSSPEIQKLKQPQKSPAKPKKLSKKAEKQFSANVESLITAIIAEDKQKDFGRPSADKTDTIESFIAEIASEALITTLGDMLQQNGMPKGPGNKGTRVKALLFHLIDDDDEADGDA